MKVLLSWLREFAPLDAPADDLGHTMSMLGMAVESMDHIGEGLDGIVVSRVLELRSHPNADRMQLVDVDAGDGEPLQVCCGAFNMRAGDLVPLATIGTTMPGGWKIERAKKRGEWSNGMLCSPTELNLPGGPEGILILPETLQPGMPLAEALGIETDVLYDLEINPNRPDAMSVAGVARDLAAHYGVPFTLPSPAVAEANGAPANELASVEIIDGDRCGRFVARVLRGVRIGPSPTTIANRLTLLGMRPINNVVDASNYVMLELGQPNHPYDLARLGGRGIRVRCARDGETITTLDDVERHLTTDDLLICDAGDRPIGIAGIIGGADTEIAESTTDVLLEMAWFASMPIAKSSRRLGVRTEASARFEKGTDPEIIELAALRFVELLGADAAQLASGIIDVRGELPVREPVRLRTARVNRILGTQLEPGEIARLLEALGFGTTPVGGDHDVVIPSWRPDCSIEIDLVEEVARLYGYDRIGAEVPPAVRFGALTPLQHERRRIREALVGLGLSEAMPMPFLAPGDLARSGLPDDGITITNPLVAEESVLRTSLLPGLLKAIAFNESHRNAGAALFEIGHVFRRPTEPSVLPDEREFLAVAKAGAEAPAAVEILDALLDHLAVRDVELTAEPHDGLHPTRSLTVSVGDVPIGVAGEVDPAVLEAHGIAERVAWLELDLHALFGLPHGDRPYRLVSRFPSSDVDLAFEVAESVPAARVEAAIADGVGDLLAGLSLFDVYRGPGLAPETRSLAFRVRLQAPNRTLTDDELAAARQRAIDAVVGAGLGTLRG